MSYHPGAGRGLAALILLVWGCGGGGATSTPPPPPPPPNPPAPPPPPPPPGPPGTSVTVQVINDAFQPATFQLKAGGIVTFTWATGASGHSVAPVPPNTIPVSSNPSPPGLHSAPYTFDTTFPSVGVFKFFCTAHGAPDSGMHGTVTVVP